MVNEQHLVEYNPWLRPSGLRRRAVVALVLTLCALHWAVPARPQVAAGETCFDEGPDKLPARVATSIPPPPAPLPSRTARDHPPASSRQGGAPAAQKPVEGKVSRYWSKGRHDAQDAWAEARPAPFESGCQR
jgi:hypothetical protein